MPCLLVLLVLAFPRVAVALLWFFTSFFSILHSGLIVPLLGFLFLPLTLIVYTYLLRSGGPIHTPVQFLYLFIAAILDLGLSGGSALRRRD